MFHSTNHQAVIMAASVCATDLFRFTLSLIHFYLTYFASIFLIPALSKLHCQNADNRLTFKS